MTTITPNASPVVPVLLPLPSTEVALVGSSSSSSNSSSSSSSMIDEILAPVARTSFPLIEGDKRRSKVNRALAPRMLEKLNWPLEYNSLSVKDAIQMHLIKIMDKLNKQRALNPDGICLFFKLLDRLKDRPFHYKNRKSFEIFTQKLFQKIHEAFVASLLGKLGKIVKGENEGLQTQCLLTYLLAKTGSKEFEIVHLKTYELLTRQLAREMCDGVAQELTSEFKCLSFFAFEPTFNHLKVEDLRLVRDSGIVSTEVMDSKGDVPDVEEEAVSSSISPLLIDDTLTYFSGFIGAICSVIDLTFKDLEKDIITRKSKVIAKGIRKVSAKVKANLDIDFYEKLIIRMKQFYRIYKAQKKLLLKQIEVFSQATHAPTPVKQYALSQILTSLNLLVSQIEQFSAFTNKKNSKIEYFLSKEETRDIRRATTLYNFADEEDTLDKERFSEKVDKLRLSNQALIQKITPPGKSPRDLLTESNAFITCLQPLLDILPVTTTTTTTTSPTHSSSSGEERDLFSSLQLLKVVSDLKRETDKLRIESQNLLFKAKNFKRREEKLEIDIREQYANTLEELARSRRMKPEELAELKEYFRQIFTYLCSFGNRFKVCKSTITIVRSYIEKYQPYWLGSGSQVAAVDIDDLWPVMIDRTSPLPHRSKASQASRKLKETNEGKTEAKPKETKEEKRSRSEVAARKTSTIRHTPSPERCMLLEASTCLQKFYPLMQLCKVTPSQHPFLSRIARQDAAYHWGVFGSVLDLTQSILRTGQHHLLPAIAFAGVRSSSVCTEQLLSSDRLLRGTRQEDLTHSQLDTAGLMPIAIAPSLKFERERQLLLGHLDTGTVFHRYPHNTLKIYEKLYKRKAPTALQWLLKPESCIAEELIKGLMIPTLHFMEMHVGGGCFKLSERIAKELLEAASVAPKASIPNPMSDLLRTRLTPTLTTIKGLMVKAEEYGKEFTESEHLLADKIALTWQDAAFLFKTAGVLVESWISFPEIPHLSAHVDSLFACLQFADELIGLALHMSKTQQILRDHSLQGIRQLEGFEESETSQWAIEALDIGIGAQYPHRYKQILYRRDGLTKGTIPLGVLMRLQALELSVHNNSMMGMTTVISRGETVTIEEMHDSLIKILQGITESAKHRMR